MSEIFHVHSFRCKHAGNAPDSAYIKKAVELGASKITFTDHAPFPDNPFGNRMDISELPEYIGTLNCLKTEYKNHIEVVVGLEIEFIPMYLDYYQELYNLPGLDMLMIGQHFYQHEDGRYSFSDSLEFRKTNEATGVIDAIIKGIETDMFTVVAHPDRAFRYCAHWTDAQEALSRKLICAALKHNVKLELNESSKKKGLFRKEFWSLLSEVGKATDDIVIKGLDAHSVKELTLL